MLRFASWVPTNVRASDTTQRGRHDDEKGATRTRAGRILLPSKAARVVVGQVDGRRLDEYQASLAAENIPRRRRPG